MAMQVRILPDGNQINYAWSWDGESFWSLDPTSAKELQQAIRSGHTDFDSLPFVLQNQLSTTTVLVHLPESLPAAFDGICTTCIDEPFLGYCRTCGRSYIVAETDPETGSDFVEMNRDVNTVSRHPTAPAVKRSAQSRDRKPQKTRFTVACFLVAKMWIAICLTSDSIVTGLFIGLAGTVMLLLFVPLVLEIAGHILFGAVVGPGVSTSKTVGHPEEELP